ncbi:phage tail protein [Pectobacterium carotovorum]|uniref:phage tail protein n=1 Tax=Pectobacterium carotovorum TaxID=554 RepID=UPI003AFB7D93
MANLPEQKEWIDGIYQLETSDPVIGGPGGISNRQAEQLANRTAYLKEQQEKTGADLVSHTKAADPHTQYAPKLSPALTGTPTAPTAAAGVNNAQIATTAYVMAAIAALVNGSPGALDTLKELATALGNDPNFSTTILNKLAQRLEKEQNGADIPDKAKFMANVGLKSAATRAVGSGASDIPDITTGDGRYLGKTATAVAATKLAAARKIAGIAFDGTADIALTPDNIGALPITGGTLTGSLISTVADVLRMVYGGYGAILRQDGGGVYILLTNKDAANGAFNSLRPFRIDLATGNIEFGHTANASVLQEKGQRVYSPNNKPSASDIGALPADGTAAAATKLSMARKIAGVAFDGSADIALTPANVGALPAAGTAAAATKLAVARKIAGVAFDGTADISLTSDNIGALPAAGTAAAATKLATARKINGVAFDGTADISVDSEWSQIKNVPAASYDVAGVVVLSSSINSNSRTIAATAQQLFTAHSIATNAQAKANAALPADGTAAAATKLATPRKINGVAFDGTTDINLPSDFPVGAPVPYPSATPPAGWIKCNGQPFNKSAYPQLATAYPSGVLPDLRGEFVRGWDDGRGVDAGRGLLSVQGDAIRNITGQFETVDHPDYSLSGVFSTKRRDGASLSGQYVGQHHTYVDFDASKVVPTANENRPRNIAFNYIVRAA